MNMGTGFTKKSIPIRLGAEVGHIIEDRKQRLKLDQQHHIPTC